MQPNQVGEIFEISICKECGSNTEQMGYVNRVPSDIETTDGTVGLYMCGGCMAMAEGSEIYFLDGVEVGRGDDPVDDYDFYEIDDSRYDAEFKNHCEFIDEDQPFARHFRELFQKDPVPVFQLTALCDKYQIRYINRNKNYA